MIILGIESTAHTTGIGIIEVKDKDKIKVISNKKHTLITQEGGLIPHQIADHHALKITTLTQNALKEGGISIKDIDMISYSHGPGFGSGLQIANIFAKTLSRKHNIKIMPVHHGAAHILVAKYLLGIRDGIYLYVSGGNTQIISLNKDVEFKVYGETEDIAIGNALDKLAREMGYGFPGGKIIESLAKEGDYVEMPYTVKGMDIALSGILTYAINLLKKGIKKEDIAFSFQEHTFAMLTEALERAMAYTQKKEVCVVGGVGMNQKLQQMVKIMAEERKAKYYSLPSEYLGDNGVMIAIAGYHYSLYSSFDEKKIWSSNIKSRWRIEDAFKIL